MVPMDVHNFVDVQNFVYAIGDRTTAEVVVIDACWDVDGARRDCT